MAASFDKVSRFAKGQNWDLKLLSWAFMFVGERCFEGTRAFSTQGIDKAILNLFRMYAKMGTQELAFESSGAKDPLGYADLNGSGAAPDIAGFATLNGSQSLEVLIYNHHDDWDMSDEWTIELAVETPAVRQQRADREALPDRRGAQQRLRRVAEAGPADLSRRRAARRDQGARGPGAAGAAAQRHGAGRQDRAQLRATGPWRIIAVYHARSTENKEQKNKEQSKSR